ncbi:MAG: AbgT family transporter, partial [Planctomycetota bacterium]
LAFVAGQFVAYFAESNLGKMLAFSGGEWLFEQRLDKAWLLAAFILVTMVFNLFVGSMSAKYALFAPIFVPMFMLIGIRPELTMVAYRIGDSTSNIITPLNAYLVIVLVFMQRYAPTAGIGTLIAMMLPYTIVFTIAWMILLIAWDALGIPLGPSDPNAVFMP